jgi:hypothetical protein
VWGERSGVDAPAARSKTAELERGTVASAGRSRASCEVDFKHERRRGLSAPPRDASGRRGHDDSSEVLVGVWYSEKHLAHFRREAMIYPSARSDLR